MNLLHEIRTAVESESVRAKNVALRKAILRIKELERELARHPSK